VKIYGLDLSLASTGIACNAGWSDTLKPPAKLRGHERMAWLLEQIRDHVRFADLVVVEGPSYGNQGQQRQSGHHERAGLWWLTTHALWRAGTPVAVAPPASVKKFATGSGNAKKDDVLLAAARRFDWFDGDNNAADSVWLAALGAEHLGEPMVEMPKAHRVALAGVAWPDAQATLGVAA
jgi:Holliday junction resolvasome RuvABC endonuclease subunit